MCPVRRYLRGGSGVLLWVVEGAEVGAGIGALVLALIVGWGLARYGVIVGMLNRLRSGPVVIGVFGALVGAIPGALVGPAVVALFMTWKGAIVGGLAGAGLARLLGKIRRFSFDPWAITFLGVCTGELFVAVCQNPEEAGVGALYGLRWRPGVFRGPLPFHLRSATIPFPSADMMGGPIPLLPRSPNHGSTGPIPTTGVIFRRASPHSRASGLWLCGLAGPLRHHHASAVDGGRQPVGGTASF